MGVYLEYQDNRSSKDCTQWPALAFLLQFPSHFTVTITQHHAIKYVIIHNLRTINMTNVSEVTVWHCMADSTHSPPPTHSNPGTFMNPPPIEYWCVTSSNFLFCISAFSGPVFYTYRIVQSISNKELQFLDYKVYRFTYFTGSRYSASCKLRVASSSCECELRVRVASSSCELWVASWNVQVASFSLRVQFNSYFASWTMRVASFSYLRVQRFWISVWFVSVCVFEVSTECSILHLHSQRVCV